MRRVIHKIVNSPCMSTLFQSLFMGFVLAVLTAIARAGIRG